MARIEASNRTRIHRKWFYELNILYLVNVLNMKSGVFQDVAVLR